MLFLSNEECRTWAARHGFKSNASFGHPIEAELTAAHRFRIPGDSGARVALARGLWESVTAGGAETLVWVTDSGIWPSGEHRPIADAVRRDLGATTPLEDSPGHVARHGEDDQGLSILVLALLFLWDCWLLPAGSRRAVFVSHDEYGTANVEGDDDILRRLAALGVLDGPNPQKRAV